MDITILSLRVKAKVKWCISFYRQCSKLPHHLRPDPWSDKWIWQPWNVIQSISIGHSSPPAPSSSIVESRSSSESLSKGRLLGLSFPKVTQSSIFIHTITRSTPSAWGRDQKGGPKKQSSGYRPLADGFVQCLSNPSLHSFSSCGFVKIGTIFPEVDDNIWRPDWP